MIKLGLIGVGGWGQKIVNTINSIEDIELVYAANKHNWKQLLNTKEVDGVIIATPPGSHSKIAIKALKKGLPILIEKPLTLSYETANNIYEASKLLKNPIVMVNHIHLYSNAWKEIKKATAIRSVITLAGDTSDKTIKTYPLWDWGAHDIAMCIDLFNEIPKVKNAVKLGDSNNYNIILDFTGKIASINIGSSMPSKHRYFKVNSFKGYKIVYDDTFENKIRINGNNVPINTTSPLTNVINAFSNSIKSKKKNVRDLLLGIQVVRILEQCEKELKNGE